MQTYFDHDIEPVKLDYRDKAILELLNENPRMSITNIAKKTGIPKDSVNYRIKRMEKEQVFSYAAIINPLKLGLPIYNTVLLKLVHVSEKDFKLIKGFIDTHPHIAYSAKLIGRYDFAISIIAKNMLHFEKIFSEFKSKFDSCIKEYEILSVLEEYKFDYLVDLIED